MTTPTPAPAAKKPSFASRLSALARKFKPELRHLGAGVAAAAATGVPLLFSSHGHLTVGDIDAIVGAFVVGTGAAAHIPGINKG